MRLLCLLFLFAGCSSQLKYKYSFTKRYLASLTDESVKVAKITVELKNPKIFASGMDSTHLIVRLFDEDGERIKDVDPADLTLASSEDIEAKPFTLKQGVYKAEILPRIESENIILQVDWQEKVSSPQIILETTTAPLKEQLKPLNHEYAESRYIGEINVSRGSAMPETSTEGFELTQLQGDDVSRSFHFDYLEQARQNIFLQVDDAPNDTVSHTMHSHFVFFPRLNLPLVKQLTGTIEVTLPNSEKIIFQKESKKIVGGVFEESAVDTSPNRSKRHYANLRYRGKGVLLRANARGQSPQLGQHETEKIDDEFGVRGSVGVLIIHGPTGERCHRPKSDFWEPLDVSPIEFKFPTDEEFDQYLKSNCGFGLPKF
jgi:hypothetical protein